MEKNNAVAISGSKLVSRVSRITLIFLFFSSAMPCSAAQWAAWEAEAEEKLVTEHGGANWREVNGAKQLSDESWRCASCPNAVLSDRWRLLEHLNSKAHKKRAAWGKPQDPLAGIPERDLPWVTTLGGYAWCNLCGKHWDEPHSGSSAHLRRLAHCGEPPAPDSEGSGSPPPTESPPPQGSARASGAEEANPPPGPPPRASTPPPPPPPPKSGSSSTTRGASSSACGSSATSAPSSSAEPPRLYEGCEIPGAPPHVVLCVPAGAPFDIVRRAYLRLALRWHPDKRASDPKAVAVFQRIQAAYEAMTS